MATAGMILIIFGILLIVLLQGSPVASAMGFAAVAAILIFMEPRFLIQFGGIAFNQGTNMNMLIAPMFILMSEFLARGGIAEDLFTVLDIWTRKFRGGLAIATTLACTIFAALCGSSPATAASMGRISIGEMIKRNYSESFAAGTVAAGGTLGIMIPPSITFVVFGILTETSIVKLFMAGLLPGILLAALICISIIIRVRLNPALAGEGQKQTATAVTAPAELPTPKTTVGGNVKAVTPAFALIIIVLGAMYTGLATAMEAAGFGVIGAFIIISCQRRMSKELILSSLESTTKTGSMIIMLIISGCCVSYVVSYLGIASSIAEAIVASGLNRYVVMLLLYVLWLILGCLMDPSSMVILTIPFIYPALIAMGFDPLWIGVVSTLCVEIGMITPPVGLNLFVLKANTDVSMSRLIKGTFPYVAVLIIGLAIITVFPGITTFLPSRM